MKSELVLVSELWEVIKPSIISTDRSGVADNIASVMVDHGYGVDEIREAFRGDYDIVEALKYYSDEEWTDEEEEDSDDWDLNDDDADDDW